MQKAALRLVKRECIQKNISWEIKKACDLAIFDNTGITSVQQFCKQTLKEIELSEILI